MVRLRYLFKNWNFLFHSLYITFRILSFLIMTVILLNNLKIKNKKICVILSPFSLNILNKAEEYPNI